MLAFALALNLVSVAQGDSRFSHHIALDEEGGFNLWWLPQKDTITFKTEVKDTDWLSLRFSTNLTVKDLAGVEDVGDSWSMDTVVIRSDGASVDLETKGRSYHLLEGRRDENGKLTAVFRRAWDNGDKLDTVLDMEEGILEAVRVTWAYRTGGSQKNGSASLNLREDPDSRLPDLSPDQPLRTYEIIAIVIVFLIFFAIPAAITACIRKRTTRYNLFKKHEPASAQPQETVYKSTDSDEGKEVKCEGKQQEESNNSSRATLKDKFLMGLIGLPSSRGLLGLKSARGDLSLEGDVEAAVASTANWPADSLGQLMTKLEGQVETNETAVNVTTATIEGNASDEDSRESGDESESYQQPEADQPEQAREAKEENTSDEGTEKSAAKQNDIVELDASTLPLMTPQQSPTLRERFLSLFKKTPELVTSDLDSSSSVGTGLSSGQLSEDSKEASETDKMLKSVRFSSKLDVSAPSESGTMIIHDTNVQETAVIVKAPEPDNISEASSMPEADQPIEAKEEKSGEIVKPKKADEVLQIEEVTSMPAATPAAAPKPPTKNFFQHILRIFDNEVRSDDPWESSKLDAPTVA